MIPGNLHSCDLVLHASSQHSRAGMSDCTDSVEHGDHSASCPACSSPECCQVRNLQRQLGQRRPQRNKPATRHSVRAWRRPGHARGSRLQCCGTQPGAFGCGPLGRQQPQPCACGSAGREQPCTWQRPGPCSTARQWPCHHQQPQSSIQPSPCGPAAAEPLVGARCCTRLIWRRRAPLSCQPVWPRADSPWGPTRCSLSPSFPGTPLGVQQCIVLLCCKFVSYSISR